MKYFREFETADELSAWQSSSEYAKPNVVLADGVVYYNTPRYGVFIQHVNGTLYDEAGWTNGGFSNDVANGVAVITAKASFVIAKNDLGKMVWSSNTSTLVDGILTSTDSAIAANDFAGYDNTQLMLATDVSGAGYSCANFVFPNGDKGYLPAFGELEEALLKKSKINSVMVLIGGEGFAIGTYWSSTQQDRLNSWVLNSINGGAGISSKNGTVNVRAFSRL